jgi:Leucine-rich repeat (LRR) protein
LKPQSKAGEIKVLSIVLPDFDLCEYGEDFLKFKKLKELILQSDVLQPNLLPDDFGKLQTIESLYILNFNYKEFPEWIFNLKNIRHLMLRGNDIEKIPDDITKLKKLEKLRIENCALKELPISFSELRNLKQLLLSDNSNLTTLNADTLPNKLKVLNLAASGISNETIKRIENRFPKLRINQHVD